MNESLLKGTHLSVAQIPKILITTKFMHQLLYHSICSYFVVCYILNHDGIPALKSHYRKNFIKNFPCFTKYFYDKYLGKDNDLMNVTCVIFEYVKGII